jgi:A/G-specific adenine glycosylase
MPDSGPHGDLAAHLIAWQQLRGRHNLPWQNTRDPYAIWVSEIMLQQTQVSAVIPYYRRFMAVFPDIASLAVTDQDEVLRHWSGLGYYSRARNLHAAAKVIMGQHRGKFPQELDSILALPGIGRSTAAAIAVFAFGHRSAILDGNVKRVLTRIFGITGWPGQPVIEKQLWALAESLLPETGMEAYTQGLMDLGATICTRGNPACNNCPLQKSCVACSQKRTDELPAPRPRKALPDRHTVMLLLCDGNDIFLEKRPPTGIWGGLWSLPQVTGVEEAQHAALERFGLETELLPALKPFTHTFTHFRLHIAPQPLRVVRHRPAVSQAGGIWLSLDDAIGAALPSPIRALLTKLN